MNLNDYQRFVESVTSDESNSINAFYDRIEHLNNTTAVNMPLLLTASVGLAAEGGEFNELPKKIIFQGKPLNEDTTFHMKRELGDILWYWINACRALNLDPEDVVAENVRKLEARYPGGEFDSYFSENRKASDL